ALVRSLRARLPVPVAVPRSPFSCAVRALSAAGPLPRHDRHVMPHALCRGLRYCSAKAAGTPPPPASGASSGAAAPLLWRGLKILAKGVFLWLPALVVWFSLASGSSLLDFRTPEEIQEDENEVLRLERYFDVEHLPEAEYLPEWATKEE
ncbi:unnamed protein product, partial [Polarella glacialis]